MDSSPVNQPPRGPFLNFFKSPAKPYPPGGEGDGSWAVAIHLSALAGLVVPGIGHWLAPLLLWLFKRPESAYLDEVGKEVLNFQITFTIFLFVSGVLAGLLWCLILPFLLPLAVTIAWLVLVIVASIKVGNGEAYRYPATLRLIK